MGSPKVRLVGLFVALGVCAVLIAYMNRHWLIPSAAHDIRIEVAGAEGLHVEGTFEVDGETQTRNGVVPATFTFHARNLTYTITKGDQPGELSVTVFIDGVNQGHTSGTNKNARGV